MNKDAITIFTAKRARQLLHEGYEIIDIKPDKLDPTGKRTLFIFKYKEGIIQKCK